MRFLKFTLATIFILFSTLSIAESIDSASNKIIENEVNAMSLSESKSIINDPELNIEYESFVDLGNQNKDMVAGRSTGCSTGCSYGCSYGCR